jgi:hypothetical protein
MLMLVLKLGDRVVLELLEFVMLTLKVSEDVRLELELEEIVDDSEIDCEELAANVIDEELDRVCDILLVNEEDPLNERLLDRVCETLDVNDGE